MTGVRGVEGMRPDGREAFSVMSSGSIVSRSGVETDALMANGEGEVEEVLL